MDGGKFPASCIPRSRHSPRGCHPDSDGDIETDYYRATTFDCSVQPDCVQVQGADRYYEIWFGHRIAYVRAADVTIQDGVATAG